MRMESMTSSMIARAIGLEQHGDIAAIRFGQKKSKLGAGAARERGDFGRRFENRPRIVASSASVSAIVLCGRRGVIEREGAFVEGGQIVGAGECGRGQ